jgi:hypothetical protein
LLGLKLYKLLVNFPSFAIKYNENFNMAQIMLRCVWQIEKIGKPRDHTLSRKNLIIFPPLKNQLAPFMRTLNRQCRTTIKVTMLNNNAVKEVLSGEKALPFRVLSSRLRGWSSRGKPKKYGEQLVNAGGVCKNARKFAASDRSPAILPI